ncbi:VOC family protein [Chloroflexota bacterium]
MTFKIKHLHIKTPHPQETAKWWVENLGAKILPEDAPNAIKLELDSIVVNVGKFSEQQTRLQRYGLEHMAVSTDDFKNVVNKLKANGARFLEETSGGAVFLETPDGVQLEVFAIDK